MTTFKFEIQYIGGEVEEFVYKTETNLSLYGAWELAIQRGTQNQYKMLSKISLISVEVGPD